MFGVFMSWLISAGILGLIIAALDDGEFPGWVPMAICVLATVFPSALVSAFVPGLLFVIPLAVGAACGGIAISATCGLSLQRSSLAAFLFLAFGIVWELAGTWLFG